MSTTETENSVSGSDSKRAAVYLPFQTLLTVLSMLREAMPSRVDRSVFKNLSGSSQYEVMAALKFFDLIDDKGKPSETLTKLAAADTASQKSVLKDLLKGYYPALFAQNLSSMTYSQFEEIIGTMNVSGATKVRAIRFFIAAAEYTGVALSTFIKAQKPAAPSKMGRSGRSSGRGRSAGSMTAEVKGSSDSGESPDTAAKALKTITLSNGETLSIVGRFNVFDLSKAERSFLDSLVEALQNFELSGPEAALNAFNK